MRKRIISVYREAFGVRHRSNIINVVFCLLFAAFNIFYFYAINYNVLSFKYIIFFGFLASVFCFLVLNVFYIITRDLKYSLLAAYIIVGMTFSLGRIASLIKARLGYADNILVEIAGICTVVVLLLIARAIPNKRIVIRGFKIMVLVLILTSTYSLLTKYPVSPYDTKQAGAILENRANKDVYYILLDSYPSDWVLKNYCGQKANGLTKFLELKGFSVADKSTSNYQETTMALYTTPVCQDHFLADLR